MTSTTKRRARIGRAFAHSDPQIGFVLQDLLAALLSCSAFRTMSVLKPARPWSRLLSLAINCCLRRIAATELRKKAFRQHGGASDWSGAAGILFSLLLVGRFAEPAARPASVLVDELEARPLPTAADRYVGGAFVRLGSCAQKMGSFCQLRSPPPGELTT
jgi:hypothetical protein